MNEIITSMKNVLIQVKNKEDLIQFKLFKQPYVYLKNYYNSEIPLNIYQTWCTKNLPSGMKQCVELLKKQNPIFKHFLFDDNDCRKFIEENFDYYVLETYDRLIPGAYKADLWRLCVLYINGGIYLDIKFSCVNGFRLIELTEQSNHLVKDKVCPYNLMKPFTIYNALMVFKKNHPFLLMGINQIVSNVKNKYYGDTSLSPTGPVMLGDLILKNNLQDKLGLNVDLYHYKYDNYIIYKNRFVISTIYPSYNTERTYAYNSTNSNHYKNLWENKNIYR